MTTPRQRDHRDHPSPTGHSPALDQPRTTGPPRCRLRRSTRSRHRSRPPVRRHRRVRDPADRRRRHSEARLTTDPDQPAAASVAAHEPVGSSSTDVRAGPGHHCRPDRRWDAGVRAGRDGGVHVPPGRPVCRTGSRRRRAVPGDRGPHPSGTGQINPERRRRARLDEIPLVDDSPADRPPAEPRRSGWLRAVPDQPPAAPDPDPDRGAPTAPEPVAPEPPRVPPLTPAGLLPRLRPAGSVPTVGWRGRAHRWTGGRWTPAPSAAERRHRELVEAVQATFVRPRLIALVNPKGGAGKTPAVLAAAATWARTAGR